MRSPCIGCELELQDKNNERCNNCRDRLEYNVNVGNLSKEVLQRENGEEFQKEQISDIAETEMAIDILDLETGDSTKRYKGRKKGSKNKSEVLRKGIYIRPTEFCSTEQIQIIMEGIKEIANQEFRSMPQQVLWILKETVEKWNREKREG